jgi:hypothetical protein
VLASAKATRNILRACHMSISTFPTHNKGPKRRWKFVYQVDVPRSEASAKFDWYKKNAHALIHSGVIQDIELM